MSRLSYGGDLFSPVRNDASFNSILSNENSKTNAKDLLDVSSKTMSSKDDYEPSERRRNTPLKEVTMHHKNKKVEGKHKKNDKPASNSNSVLIPPCVKIKIASEVPVKDPLRKSKRLHKHEERVNKDEIESKGLNYQCSSTLNSKTSVYSTKVSKRKGNDKSMSFVTVRERDCKKEQGANHSKNLIVLSKPPEILEETTSSLESSNQTSTRDDSVFSLLHTISETSKLEPPTPSDQAILHSQQNEGIDIAGSKTSSSTDISELKDMAPAENKVAESKPSNKNDSDLKNTMQDFSCIPAVLNEPDQVQAKIIEKLITDTVSSQFDVLRQQMYLQQISILKVLNQTREESENRHSKHIENLYNLIGNLSKVIEELSEENKQLKSAIIAWR